MLGQLHRGFLGRTHQWACLGALAAIETLASGDALGQQTPGQLQVHRSRLSNLATWVTPTDSDIIPVALPAGRTRPQPGDFLYEHGHLFGITDIQEQLTEVGIHTDSLGSIHTTYQQYHQGVPVFSGVMKVHQNSKGDVVAANGHFHPVSQSLQVIPSLNPDDAISVALAAVSSNSDDVEGPLLVIVDPGWYGDPPIGAHLAYYVVLTDMTVSLREAFFIDAHSGAILDQWKLLCTARFRKVYDGQGTSTLPGVLVRTEGDPPVSAPEDANRAYDYAGDVYDYFDRAFGRDGIDDAGMITILTVDTDWYCPNAFWNGEQVAFCLDTVGDDVVGHEITHGITHHTAGLIYQNQPGQLNESFSDVFGELVDLFNGDAAYAGPPAEPPQWPAHPTGNGTDTPNGHRTGCSPAPEYGDGVRWLVSEDAVAFSGAIRDMWDPTCEGDPDRANSILQKCYPLDNGGVHSGCGIPSHAFTMLVDGKTFNGYTVNTIGPIKAGAVWYRALTVYMTVVSDFEDAFHCFNQAAQDLIGTYPNDPRTGVPGVSMFTADDAVQVESALRAVEMDGPGRCGAVLSQYDLEQPDECPAQYTIYSENFDTGPGGWTMITTAPPGVDGWVLTDCLPRLREGLAWFCTDTAPGDYGDAAVSISSLYSPPIVIPLDVDRPFLSFRHLVSAGKMSEGGNLKISVDGGPWTLIPTCAINHNPYHWVIIGTGNALYREPTWSGISEDWIVTLVDLSGFAVGGETIELAFEYGNVTYASGYQGWYVDDVRVYACGCADEQDCDDGVFCNGFGTCAGGFCRDADPCSGQACDDDTDACVPTAFFENFENGNAQGWDLRASGSTATEGDWVIGDPVGSHLLMAGIITQPLAAAGGCGCAFTGESEGEAHHGNVADGVVFMVSPPFDLSGQIHAALSYARWFYVRDATGELYASFTVDASADDGATWAPVEVITKEATEAGSDGTWIQASHRLETVIPLTDTVRLRFGANEETLDYADIVEAAIDDVAVSLVDLCDVGAGDTDCNGNGRQDWCDLEDSVSPDCNANGIPDECDIEDNLSNDCQPNGVPDECEIVPGPFVVEFLLDEDPGWTTEGLWEFGVPHRQGDGLGGFDPGSGHTGDLVFGYNLWGHYENDLPERHLTTGPIDCSKATNVHLSFWRWLCVEQPPYDHASVQVSNDGTNWTTIWANDSECLEWAWHYQDFDISESADGQPTVYVRWTMGPTDGNWQYCGWNIDDILIYGDSLTGSEGDCNGNRVPDECDIASGTSLDANADGVPDECEAAIPTLTDWGLSVFALLLLTCGTLVLWPKRKAWI